MVGRDGGVGISSALDGKIAMSRAIVQLGGDAMVCEQAAFRGAALQSRVRQRRAETVAALDKIRMHR
jgi:hypothetical protein